MMNNIFLTVLFQKLFYPNFLEIKPNWDKPVRVEKTNKSFVEDNVLEVLEFPVVDLDLVYDAVEEIEPKSYDLLTFFNTIIPISIHMK